MTSTQRAAGTRRQIGSGIPLLEAASRANVPVREVKRLVVAGIVFALDGRVSDAAISIIRQHAERSAHPCEPLMVAVGRVSA